MVSADVELWSFGDSLIKGNPEPAEGGWLAHAEAELLRPKGIQLKNFSKGGNTTRDVINDIQQRMPKDPPPLCIVGVGVNDSRQRASLGMENEVPFDEFRKNIREIISVTKEISSPLLLVAPIIVIDSLTNPFKPDKFYKDYEVSRYRQALLAIANDSFVSIADPHQPWKALDASELSEFLPDGLHPSARGYRFLYEAIKPDLEAWLDQATADHKH